MSNSLRNFAVLILAGLVFAASQVQASTLVEDFSDSPFADDGGLFTITGLNIGPDLETPQFVYEAGDLPAFDGDPSAGSLVVHYNSLHPTTRFSAPLGLAVTDEDSFSFGAIMTIEREGYAPSATGYMEMAFGLTNSETTGTDRTGDLEDYAADTYDMVEFDYFANESDWFGGPYVALSIFGAPVVSDAFGNFVYSAGPNPSSFPLPLDTPLFVQVDYDVETTTATLRVSEISSDGSLTELDTGLVPLNIFDTGNPWAPGLTGGFSVDTISISAYQDGWNSTWLPTSLVATVIYDKLFFTTGNEPPEINALSVSPREIWPPNRKDVPVTVTVDVSDADGNLESITVLVTDEYGEDQTVSYTAVAGAGGIYDITINLEAWRDGNDFDGRLYTIDVVAADAEGLTDDTYGWEDAASALVPHDMLGKK